MVSGSATIGGACESGVMVDLAGAGVSAPVQTACANGTYGAMVVFTNGAGAKVILVSQTDAAGNSSNFTRSVSRQAEQGPAIAITAPASTQMACPEPEGVMEQEASYLAALPEAARFRVEGGALELLRADGTFVATFAPE